MNLRSRALPCPIICIISGGVEPHPYTISQKYPYLCQKHIKTAQMRIKNFLYVMMAAVMVSFAACSSDDPNEEPEKPFVWNGDWNDPNDPNYKPEGYNPIQGLWRNLDPNKLSAYFSDDFIYYTVQFVDGIPIKDKYSKYKINDTAFDHIGRPGLVTKYKIYGNKMITNYAGDSGSEYVRVEE